MTQVITGPFGRLAYYAGAAGTRGQYPALNLPCTAFARAGTHGAANKQGAPHALHLPRRRRVHAAVAMFGEPITRKN